MQMPDDVRAWVRGVFRACSVETAVALSRMPNRHEVALDLAFIAKAADYAAPVRFPSDWVVRIDTHFLGGRRHFYHWEIADIGLPILFRRGGTLVKTKVALLQSKRLDPIEREYDEAEAVSQTRLFALRSWRDEPNLWPMASYRDSNLGDNGCGLPGPTRRPLEASPVTRWGVAPLGNPGNPRRDPGGRSPASAPKSGNGEPSTSLIAEYAPNLKDIILERG